ncbi:hypothetical protein B0H17DRAFT_1136965 [Mycena rosella]|uniref:Uncharacterized protein n=1 Tax=Mycena rosella TaxID=1033263 RepID=A0AAD7DA78_MYCRO|nr:hypothetical protein B0H17DRAFT_1136965 [Mycena rosella]
MLPNAATPVPVARDTLPHTAIPAPAFRPLALSTPPSKKRRTEREEEEEMELDGERARDLDQTAHAFVQRARLFRIDATIQQLECERGSLTAQLDLCKYTVLTLLSKIVSEIDHCMIDDMLRGPTSGKTSITLPHLESLVFLLYVPDKNPIHHIFPISMMELPALRILEIPETYLRHPSCDDLHVLVDSWECSLQELRIIDLAQTSEQTYIEKFPSIPLISFHRQVPRAIVGREDDEDKQAQVAGGGIQDVLARVQMIEK